MMKLARPRQLRRTILLSVSTRGAGFIVRDLAANLWQLEIPDIDIYRLTNALYRVTLLQLEEKQWYVDLNMNRNAGGGGVVEAFPEEYHEVLDSIDDRFADLRNYLAVVGIFKGYHTTYQSQFVKLNNDNVNCDPINVRINRLYDIVTCLASEETPANIRKTFYDLNPIPGAIWSTDMSNVLLLNPNDIMPFNYNIQDLRKDIDIIGSAVEMVGRREEGYIFRGCPDCSLEGYEPQLVSCSPISKRCSTFEDDKVTPSSTAENAHFWSPEHMSDDKFAFGAICLFGERSVDCNTACICYRSLAVAKREAIITL